MRATICSTMCLLKVIITKSFCGREKSSHTKPRGSTKGDNFVFLPGFPSSPLYFSTFSSGKKEAGERKKKAAHFLPVFSHSLDFLLCFCSLVLPILILPKLPFPEAQGHFTPSTMFEWKNSQRNPQPLHKVAFQITQGGNNVF